jgi:hypothetical protein
MKKTAIIGLISVLLVCAIVFTAFTPSFALSTASSTGIEFQPSLKETDRNSYYALVFESLIDSFPKVLINDGVGEREVVAYPQEYAGAYIDNSNTLHIVLTKNANMATYYNYQEKLVNDKDIVYDIADVPLSRLYEIQRSLDVVMQKFNIESTSLNEITNKLEIHLLDITKQKDVTEFLKTKFNDFDVNSVIFMDPVGIQLTADDTTSNALAGSNTASSTEGATLGFNAYRHATGQAGVVTAGHYATSGTTIKNAMGTTIGAENIRQYSGTIDAAFVPFPTAITWSYKLHGYGSPDDSMTHYYPNSDYVTGETVNKIGRTTGITSGTIDSVSTSVTVSGVTFTDQVKVSNQQLAGDSGGPVFHTVVNTGTDFHILVGIATFGEVNSPNRGYVSKVNNIMSAFGITPFYGE